MRVNVAAAALLLLTCFSLRPSSRPVSAEASTVRIRVRRSRPSKHIWRRSETAPSSGAISQLLLDEPWRHDEQFQVLSGRIQKGVQYYSKFSVNRPLWGIFKMFEAQGLEAKLEANPTLTVLELGCGEGRALLELQARFPRASVYCVNLPAYGQVHAGGGASLSGLNKDSSLETMMSVVQYYNIPWHPDTHNTPRVVYADVTEGDLPLPSGFVDVIFSRAVVSKFIIDSRFLEGLLHTLSPTGEALIQTDALYKPECSALNTPGAPSLTLMCKRLQKHGKCMKLVSQYADTTRVAGGRLFEVCNYYVMALVGNCDTYGECDAGFESAGSKLSGACGKEIPSRTSSKFKDLDAWIT